ncbi:hypothetical protein KC19_1G191500 [Ceratodon purpureus]|uniref:Uncharacterized protein n=1 Tax=Ceratodon purpureus TaxID=3225 RepID=A0A8T0J9S4_CERPU|nr:hypothetical protein KC19_1G191500 [Ceratodon purpureus]
MAFYNELFGYGPSLTPTPFSIDGVEEIVDRPPYHEVHHNMDYGYYNNHTNRYNGQIQHEPRQFYYDEHDHRRNHNHNDRGDYTRNPIPFQMDRPELSRNRISVSIRLSNARSININNLRSRLSQNHDLGCHLEGNILTVTGYPRAGSRGAENDFLTIVSNLTGDYSASVVRRS